MKKRLMFLCAATASIFLLLCGCARELIVPEVLQIPEHADLYTAYNLWYDDPMELDTLNMQKGRILPFGTRIEIRKATDREIVFRTLPAGQTFRIRLEDKYRMQTPEAYLRELVSTNDEDELTVGIRPAVAEKIRRGLVEKGMTRKEVLLAFGPPCAFRTPDSKLDTWCFWTDYLVGIRVIFNDDAVVELLKL